MFIVGVYLYGRRVKCVSYERIMTAGNLFPVDYYFPSIFLEIFCSRGIEKLDKIPYLELCGQCEFEF